MTRDASDNAEISQSKVKPTVLRRRTMGSAHIKDLIAGNEEPFKNSSDRNIFERMPTPTCTRRMSIGERTHLDMENHDWEEPRLDIEGFVVDYFCYRTLKEGYEWYDAPPLPYGTQPEHEMMRAMAITFEKKYKNEFETFCEQLLASPKITFSIYQEIVQNVGMSEDEKCSMGYGRMIGLIAFGGMLAAKMMDSYKLRAQVHNLHMYTSLFIKSRIRASWREHKKTWADFMLLGAAMKAKYEIENEVIEQNSKRNIIFLGAGIVTVIGVVIGGRLIFGSCK